MKIKLIAEINDIVQDVEIEFTKNSLKELKSNAAPDNDRPCQYLYFKKDVENFNDQILTYKPTKSNVLYSSGITYIQFLKFLEDDD